MQALVVAKATAMLTRVMATAMVMIDKTMTLIYLNGVGLESKRQWPFLQLHVLILAMVLLMKVMAIGEDTTSCRGAGWHMTIEDNRNNV